MMIQVAGHTYALGGTTLVEFAVVYAVEATLVVAFIVHRVRKNRPSRTEDLPWPELPSKRVVK